MNEVQLTVIAGKERESPHLLHDSCVKTSAREMMQTFQPSSGACGQTGYWLAPAQLHLQMCNRRVISGCFITWAAQRRRVCRIFGEM